MEERLIRRYMVTKKEDIRKLEVKERTIKLPITKSFIVSIIGARRVGKTYSIYDLALNKLKLKDSDFVYLNFEDIDLKGSVARDVIKAVEIHQQTYGSLPKFMLFDEIQNVADWESIVYSFFEKKLFHIFITGSSSKLLSKEIATKLRGRSLTYSLYTLSFKEFLKFQNFEVPGVLSSYKENEIKFMLSKYMKVGGFPDAIPNEEIAGKFFKDYLDLVIFKDVVERFGIKNIFLIKFLINSMLSSFSKEFSVNSVYEKLKEQEIKVSRKTLYSYMSILEDVFFAFFLRKFYFSAKKSQLSMPKVYINDTGIINNSLVLNFSENFGKLMENIVFIQIKRGQNDNPKLESFYFQDNSGEVDFVLKEGPKIKQLIQVTYASSKAEIDEREVKSLLKAGKELKCRNLLVITWDYEAKEKIKGGNVKFVPLWKWLLE